MVEMKGKIVLDEVVEKMVGLLDCPRGARAAQKPPA